MSSHSGVKLNSVRLDWPLFSEQSAGSSHASRTWQREMQIQKKFHLQACHHSRKSYIGKIRLQDVELSQDEDKAEAFFQHFDGILGTPGSRPTKLDLSILNLPSIGEQQLDHCLSEEEIWQTILDIPSDKAPGPDGFTGAFYRAAWLVIKTDILNAFHALWALDGRSLL